MHFFRVRSWSDCAFAVFIGFVLVMALTIGLSGCFPSFPTPTSFGDAGGYEAVVLDMPFADGYQSFCTQGAHGSYSHNTKSTVEDIDFDTPNGANDLVYAPIDGVAYVHEESATKNFGYHVNIDRGDGTYVVLGHMSQIFVSDGSQVAAGEILGYEGCTGYCSGDHVHIGLHEGDAALMAEFGHSTSVSYYLDDLTAHKEGETITSAEVVCGDASQGHLYGSKLPVGNSHPDGSLIKTPDAADVYLVENRTRHWIKDEATLWSMGYSFSDVAVISDDELACYDVGAPMDVETKIQALTDEDGQSWLLVGTENDSKRYRQAVPENGLAVVLKSWGLNFSDSAPPPSGASAEAMLSEYPITEGNAVFRDGTLLKENSKSDVYVVSNGVAMPIESFDILLKLGWGNRTILTVDDGLIQFVQGAVGNCEAGVFCLDEETIETCNTDDAVDVGGADTDAGSTTVNEDTNADPSSMLEGEIDDGEFGFAYLPPESFAPVQSLLMAAVVTDDGQVVYDDRVLNLNGNGGALDYTTSDFPNGGVSFYFIVQETAASDFHYGCTLNDAGQPIAWGSTYAEFSGQELPVSLSTAYDQGIGCSFKVHLPQVAIDPSNSDADGDGFTAKVDCNDADASINPSAVESCNGVDDDCDGLIDEGDACPSADTGSGSTSTGLQSVTICYAPGSAMSAGQLYLDGGFFTAWDAAPADAANAGDTQMCATETVVSGEQIKMNAWFLPVSTSTVEWAAFNNNCLSIDWQGTLTVNGVSVSETVAPWSASVWASDPCSEGGDAFFFVP